MLNNLVRNTKDRALCIIIDFGCMILDVILWAGKIVNLMFQLLYALSVLMVALSIVAVGVVLFLAITVGVGWLIKKGLILGGLDPNNTTTLVEVVTLSFLLCIYALGKHYD